MPPAICTPDPIGPRPAPRPLTLAETEAFHAQVQRHLALLCNAVDELSNRGLAWSAAYVLAFRSILTLSGLLSGLAEDVTTLGGKVPAPVRPPPDPEAEWPELPRVVKAAQPEAITHDLKGRKPARRG